MDIDQGAVYYPQWQETTGSVTLVKFGINRASDGFFLDFQDGEFKDSGWTTQYTALTEKSNGLWLYTTGWTVPSLNDMYMIQLEITDTHGTFYQGLETIYAVPSSSTHAGDSGLDLSTSLGKVRALIHDFTEPFILPDDIIEAYLACDPDPFMAAAMALRAMATNKAYLSKLVEAGDYKEDTKGTAKLLLDLANSYEQKAISEPAEGEYSQNYDCETYWYNEIGKDLRNETD